MMTGFDNRSRSSLRPAKQLMPIAGIEIIKQFSACRLWAYPNPKPSSPKPSKLKQSSPYQKQEQPAYLIGWGSHQNKAGELFEQGDRITQTEANELLRYQLLQESLPILRQLPGWNNLNENQQGALLSLAHSLENDRFVLSPRSLLGRALRDNRWYQIPTIIRGYHGYNPPAHTAQRRAEEANLFSSEIRREQYIVINRSRLLELTDRRLQGQDVLRLQKALIAKGYEIKADGIFGPITEWAVEKFQSAAGLIVDGVAGVKTQRVMYARTLYFTTPNLIGSDVREIQSLLARIGYSVSVTGVFNLRTCHEVVAFQKYFGLPEDGIIADKTLAKLLYLPAIAGAA